MERMTEGLGRVLDGLLSALKWLVLPIGALLFLQWPLRELFRAYSREANDFGQVLFALYAAASISAATRAGTHLTPGGLSDRLKPRTRRALLVACNLLALLPWIVFVIWSSRGMMAATWAVFERFQDTSNPGYFLIKSALWLMASALLIAIVTGKATPLGLTPAARSDPERQR